MAAFDASGDPTLDGSAPIDDEVSSPLHARAELAKTPPGAPGGAGDDRPLMADPAQANRDGLGGRAIAVTRPQGGA